MARESYQIGLVSDFNLQSLAMMLRKNAAPRELACVGAGSESPVALLLDRAADMLARELDALVVWTKPEAVIPEFQRVLSFEGSSCERLIAEVDAFVAILRTLPTNVHTVLVPTWTAPEVGRGLGNLDLAANGVARALLAINSRLATQLEHNTRVMLLDSSRWIAAGGAAAYSPRLWYISKTPFSNSVFEEAAKDILSAVDAVGGETRKVIILDLDNTLWGGIVGEDGWEGLRLGGHDAIGEAFVDFQKALKRLKNRGVLLAIASKNEEAQALEAIDRHPEMILRRDDFSAWSINWSDKAENLARVVTQLNLGLDSAVFLDDSGFERARIREALPQVLVPELPADPLYYPFFLASLRCFDTAQLTEEDRRRSSMYLADRQRAALRVEVPSLESWLRELQLKVEAEPISAANLERAAQLLNKTNQMNLTTRRLTAAELLSWAREEDHFLSTFRVTDRFGDYGLCGIASFKRENTNAEVRDFLLSCRVVGRGVEDEMLQVLVRNARDAGCESLRLRYRATPRNQPCLKWLQQHPDLQQKSNFFVLPLQRATSAAALARDAA